MKLVQYIEFLRRHLKHVIRICLGVLISLVVIDAIFVDKEHAHSLPEHWFGFWAGFGLLGCISIIFVSKWFGHAGIMVREDYYDRSPEDPKV
jgi:hypothetical protein